MWNDLPHELKSDPKINSNMFVKNKFFDTNNKYDGAFVCSYSVLIIMCLNLSVAAAMHSL